MPASKPFLEKTAKILCAELGRERALGIVIRIEKETIETQSLSVMRTLDGLIAALVCVKGGQPKENGRLIVTASMALAVRKLVKEGLSDREIADRLSTSHVYGNWSTKQIREIRTSK